MSRNVTLAIVMAGIVASVAALAVAPQDCKVVVEPAHAIEPAYETVPSPIEHVPLHVTFADHNAEGGYAPACGELPGLLGDDC